MTPFTRVVGRACSVGRTYIDTNIIISADGRRARAGVMLVQTKSVRTELVEVLPFFVPYALTHEENAVLRQAQHERLEG